MTSPSSSSALLRSSSPFQLETGNKNLNQAYQIAFQELQENVDNNKFIAGAGWAQLWTRDTSYAVELAAGLVDVNRSQATLKSCTEIHMWQDSLIARTMTTTNNDDDEEEQHLYLPANDTVFSLLEDDQTNKKNPSFGYTDVWFQDDCGHFGGWPTLSDAIGGVRGAWTIYLVGGDRSFLAKAYRLTLASLYRAELDVYDVETGLFFGVSSFMESNSAYPDRYWNNPTLVAKTRALSTNVLYYNGYKLASLMARELGGEEGTVAAATQHLEKRATLLRTAIRKWFWNDELGYYGYVLDETKTLWNQMEGLGEAFVLLDDYLETTQQQQQEDSPKRIQRMFDNIPPRTPSLGMPCLWPPFQHSQTNIPKNRTGLYYHNGRIWPFVQGYWAMAAAKHRREDIFVEEVQKLTQLALHSSGATTFDHNKHDDCNVNQTFAEFYELDGTFLCSQQRQLWSDAGYLSMIYYGLFGIRLELDGLRFQPMKPKTLFEKNNAHDPSIHLRGMTYRNTTLDITVTGSGSILKEAQWNGHVVKLEEESSRGPSVALKLQQLLQQPHHTLVMTVSPSSPLEDTGDYDIRAPIDATTSTSNFNNDRSKNTFDNVVVDADQWWTTFMYSKKSSSSRQTSPIMIPWAPTLFEKDIVSIGRILGLMFLILNLFYTQHYRHYRPRRRRQHRTR